jgi:segregation and condensation protein B
MESNMMDGTIAAAAEIEAGTAPAVADAESWPETRVCESPAGDGSDEGVPDVEAADEGQVDGSVGAGPAPSMAQELRVLEAMLFAATEPVDEASLAERMPDGIALPELLAELAAHYRGRGVTLTRVAGRWAFRTAADLAPHLRIERKVPRKLSRAAVETLSIIAYHQPVTRGEIEEIRGVALNKGTLDVLLEAGWIRPMGRRRSPGKPVTWGTSTAFLDEFGLGSLSDLPGVDELKAAGLLDTRPVTTILGEAMGREDVPSSPSDGDDADDDVTPGAANIDASMVDADEIEARFAGADTGDDGFEDEPDDDEAGRHAREG